MNKHMRQKREGTSIVAKLAATLSVSAFIVACDGANQGVQLGNGQQPDPVVIDFPIAYIKAPIPVDDNGEFEQTDVRQQITFEPGGDLYFKDRASPSAIDVNITGRITEGMGAVRDVEMAFDGSAVLFAMRYPFDPNVDVEDQVPTWNLWEYTFETDELRRLITSDLTAEIGHDIMPKYLPDGRIIFASTRQTRSQAILLDEGKAGFPAMDEDEEEFAFNLHVINRDGTGVEQVTFNQSHDLDPAILADGSIIFSRWDNAGNGNNEINLYRINPDGSGLELYYGSESHDTGANGETIQFLQPRQAEDGRVFALIRPFTDTEGGGEIISIDTDQYVENTQPLAENIGILNGPAQEDATINDVVTQAGQPSPGGRYFSVYPIQDGTGRLLVSFSQCRLIEILPDDDMDPMTPPPTDIVPCTDERLANVVAPDPDADPPIVAVEGDFTVAPPLYGIWIYDPRDETQLPVVPGEEGFMFTEVVSADPRPTPPVIFDGSRDFLLDPTFPFADRGEAVLNIRSVYDFSGVPILDIDAVANGAVTADMRPVRFLRIEKAVSIPDEDLFEFDDTAYGVTQAFGMKEIVGYIPIEPDGSVMARIPANTALMLSVLDAEGKRITTRHNNWLSAIPGEELQCMGCHVANSGVSHGRRGAFDSAYAGAQTAGIEFPNSNTQWFAGDVGQTMAEARATITCATDNCSSLNTTMDVVFRDVWSDPAVRAPDPDIDYLYSQLTTPAPTSAGCIANWQSGCRTVINYETHIHPLWSQPRIVMVDDDNDPMTPDVPLLDANGLPVNNNCLNCHTPIDPVLAEVRVPAGQLELQDGPSPDEPDHFHAYRELLATDNLQEVVNGALVDAQQVVGVDADGNDILDVIPIAPPARAAGATASGDFFGRFEDPNDLHYNILSPSERRLIAEWLDVGAQYYNNPFDAPED